MATILELALGFLGKYWKHLIIIASVVSLFFIGRHMIVTAIERHDQAIVDKTTKAKDEEWQAKLDAATLKMRKEFDDVRKNQAALKAKKPRNMLDTIKLLRDHRLNSPN